MKVLLQRVSQASVVINQQTFASIQHGLLAFIAVEHDDTMLTAKAMAKKVAHYRMFADQQQKMNLNVQQVSGAVLVVSQFTLAADTASGLRPSFSNAANHQLSFSLYQAFCQHLAAFELKVACGEFAADMQVTLTNDGPATFLLSL